MKKSNKPGFIIVGAAKAGTTSLYYYLQQHPGIWFPKLKETKYFSSKIKPYPQKGPGDWSIDQAAIIESKDYYKLFSKGPEGSIKGEASPDYLLFASKTAVLIKKELGDIPIIIILRNPIERAFSAYSNLRRDNREYLSFSEALDMEDYRIQENWDFMWHYKSGGNYSVQIKEFEKNFSKVKILLFDDLIANPLEITNEVVAFLGLTDKLHNLESEAYNPSGEPANYIVRFILNRQSKLSTMIRELLKKFIPRRMLEQYARKNLKKQKISAEEFKKLNDYYQEEIRVLETYLNKDLSKWRMFPKT